jgi:hypothetical protein
MRLTWQKIALIAGGLIVLAGILGCTVRGYFKRRRGRARRNVNVNEY